MIELSTDEQQYLMAAFTASPRDWFRPRTVDPRHFSGGEIDEIVRTLDRLGLMQGQPERHARLTDRGRKEALRLCKLAARDWRAFHARRQVRFMLASTAVALVISLVALKWVGLI
jgi:Mn-dependent DtxR family transcriptional regulator